MPGHIDLITGIDDLDTHFYERANKILIRFPSKPKSSPGAPCSFPAGLKLGPEKKVFLGQSKHEVSAFYRTSLSG